MEMGLVGELLTNVAFPIALVIYLIHHDRTMRKQHREDMLTFISEYKDIITSNNEIITSFRYIVDRRLNNVSN
jgi:hypothetical protein